MKISKLLSNHGLHIKDCDDTITKIKGSSYQVWIVYKFVSGNTSVLTKYKLYIFHYFYRRVVIIINSSSLLIHKFL